MSSFIDSDQTGCEILGCHWVWWSLRFYGLRCGYRRFVFVCCFHLKDFGHVCSKCSKNPPVSEYLTNVPSAHYFSGTHECSKRRQFLSTYECSSVHYFSGTYECSKRPPVTWLPASVAIVDCFSGTYECSKPPPVPLLPANVASVHCFSGTYECSKRPPVSEYLRMSELSNFLGR